MLRYIHQNPVRAGIARGAADYPWSSDRFLRHGSGPEWLDVDRLLSLLQASKRLAVRRYIELVDGPSASPSYESLTVVQQVVVGDDAFAAESLEAIAEPEPPLTALALDDVLEFVARETGISVAVLAGPRRTRTTAAARHLAAYLARRLCRIPARRVARRLGRDESTFARPLARLEDELVANTRLRGQIERLVRRLRRSATLSSSPAAPPAPNKSSSQD